MIIKMMICVAPATRLRMFLVIDRESDTVLCRGAASSNGQGQDLCKISNSNILLHCQNNSPRPCSCRETAPFCKVVLPHTLARLGLGFVRLWPCSASLPAPVLWALPDGSTKGGSWRGRDCAKLLPGAEILPCSEGITQRVKSLTPGWVVASHTSSGCSSPRVVSPPARCSVLQKSLSLACSPRSAGDRSCLYLKGEVTEGKKKPH